MTRVNGVMGRVIWNHITQRRRITAFVACVILELRVESGTMLLVICACCLIHAIVDERWLVLCEETREDKGAMIFMDMER